LRIYALDRLQNLKPTAIKFRMPADFDPEAYFADCYGIIHDENEDTQLIQLKVNSGQAKYIRALPLHPSQKGIERSKDYAVLSFYIKPTFDFRQEILSMGEDVEVISPAGFRNEIREVIDTMHKCYCIDE